MKRILLVIMSLAILLQANSLMLRETPFSLLKESIGKGKAQFLEIGSDSCKSCQIMGKRLYKINKKYPSYNISFVNVKKERDAAFELKIRMIPTQIILDKNAKEVYRHVGLLSIQEIEELLKIYKVGE